VFQKYPTLFLENYQASSQVYIYYASSDEFVNALSVIFGIIYMSLPIPIIATAWQRKYITDMKEFCGPIGRMYTPAELQASSKLHCELSDGKLRGRSSHRMLSRLAVPLVEVL
jgi:hypothetical protein